MISNIDSNGHLTVKTPLSRLPSAHYTVEDYYGARVIVYDRQVDPKYVAKRLADYKEKVEDDDIFGVVSLRTLINRFNEWKACLPRVDLRYAVKCNNDVTILRTLASLGCGFDCASKSEIDLILNNKITTPDQIIYANTMKTPSYIRHASKKGVTLMTFDNEEELYKIKELHANPQLILRIFAIDPHAQCSFGKKFGCDPEEEGPKLLMKAQEMGLPVVGISFHVGSGFNDTGATCKAIKDAKTLFEKGQTLGHKMEILDIGGGFPGSDEVGKLSFKKIASVIRPLLDEHFPESSGVKILAEPGRYFAFSAVSLVINVIAATKVKASRIFENPSNPEQEAYMYFVNDGIFGSFSVRVFDNYFPVGEPLVDPIHGNAYKEYPCVINGPTCDGADKIEVKEKMRKLDVGEWLFYPDMGAYTKSTATNFNGFGPSKYFYYIDRAAWKTIYPKNYRNYQFERQQTL